MTIIMILVGMLLANKELAHDGPLQCLLGLLVVLCLFAEVFLWCEAFE